MRHTLIAGIACLTLALAPLEPVHAGVAGPRPVPLALATLVGSMFDPANGERRWPAYSILPRHGVGRIDRSAPDPGRERRTRRVNTRHGRYGTPGRCAMRRPAQRVETPQAQAATAFVAGPAPPRRQERTVAQR